MRQSMGLTPSSAELADEFPNFSLGIIQEIENYFFYDLDGEEENNFFVAVDIKAFNLTDKITVEKADKRHRSKRT